MTSWTVAAALLTLTACFAYLNHRWIRLPPSIGVMTVALLLSLSLLILQSIGLDLATPLERLVNRVHFDTTLLHGLLGFLLFAGALSVDLAELRRNAPTVVFLATFGVVFSTVVVGVGTYWVLRFIDQPMPWAYCFMFGALISPTDPIAVLALLKRLGANKDLEAKIAGESLFNDGVAVTVFLLLLSLVGDGPTPSAAGAAFLLLRETLGGVAFGLLAGGIVSRLLRTVDQYTVEILLTLALVSGGFTVADWLGVSAPLAIVVAGLIIGHHGRSAMSTVTRHHLDLFWHLLDEILNAILFVLIGLEVLVMQFHERNLGVMLVLAPISLLARMVSVGVPFGLLRRQWRLSRGALGVMIWGGLRGGLSVAMALSLPMRPERNLLVTATYGVVVFSLLVQGGSLGWLLRARSSDRTPGI